MSNGWASQDRILIVWGGVLLTTSLFHHEGTFVYKAGLLWSGLGYYFLARILLSNCDDIRLLFKASCAVLLPIGMLMIWEKVTGHNPFLSLGAVSDPVWREGQFRAQGPFAHSILAGTVGASIVPVALYFLVKRNYVLGLTGFCAAVSIVVASASSGPIVMSLFGVVGMVLWYARRWMRLLLWGGLCAVVALDVVMKDPVYFLMARIDIAGGSTGWYRARLIQSAFEHINEWWLFGTDYTRHWMPTGLALFENTSDVTNQYLQMGVWGGLVLMALFLCALISGFRTVGRCVRVFEKNRRDDALLAWTLGAMLFGHVVNFLAIPLYDQSAVFFFIILSAIAALRPSKALSIAARDRLMSAGGVERRFGGKYRRRSCGGKASND
jgi:hypothetical protein